MDELDVQVADEKWAQHYQDQSLENLGSLAHPNKHPHEIQLKQGLCVVMPFLVLA
ncbi:hypothetical protein P618_200018 [Holospora obtusa F1]|uniref:Uncharacterized protein n=1 Tax=Holospora obtusa F1 TaxID=1399147 RepID=W6TVH2_HOLOB|nr:hypothetical protein P618_200018 [Holospora obtusa F1]